MELKIKEEKENPLFNRKELQFEVQAKSTPNRIEVGKSISEKLSTNLENIEIKKIEGKFGSNSFGVNAFVYESKEDRMNTELKPKLIVEEKIEEKPQEVQKNKEDQDEEKIDDKTNAAGADKDEDNNKINENVNDELTDKDNSERNESEANQTKK